MNELTVNTVSEMDIRDQVNVIQRVMNKVMIKGTHYGTIPGAGNKSTLFKPGAEKIMMTFRLSGEPEVEDLSGNDLVRYRVKTIMRSPAGGVIGYGVGECSTDEMKYKWRGAVCVEEFNATAESRRREKWQKGWDGRPAKTVQQVRTEPADLANTVLKMAKKRSLIDAVLTTTAASDCFTQDIEDLPPEYVAGNTAPVDVDYMPQRRPAPTTNAERKPNTGATASPGALKMIQAKIKSNSKTEADLCAFLKIESLEAITTGRLNEALDWCAA